MRYNLRMLSQSPVLGNRRFEPTDGDVWYLKLFLDETAENINREVGARLAVLLTTVHGRDVTLFDAGTKAQEIANLFRHAATISTEVRNPV